MPDTGYNGNFTVCDGAHDNFFGKRQQVFQRTTPARHNYNINIFCAVKVFHTGGNFGGGGLSLDGGGVQNHVHREPFAQTILNILECGTGRTCHYADCCWQFWQRFFARGIKQSLGRQFLFAFFQHFKNRTDARHFYACGNNLIIAACRICGKATGNNNLHSVGQGEIYWCPAPYNNRHRRTGIFDSHIHVSRCCARNLGQFAANLDNRERGFNNIFKQCRRIGHRKNHIRFYKWFGCRQHFITFLDHVLGYL